MTTNSILPVSRSVAIYALLCMLTACATQPQQPLPEGTLITPIDYTTTQHNTLEVPPDLTEPNRRIDAFGDTTQQAIDKAQSILRTESGTVYFSGEAAVFTVMRDGPSRWLKIQAAPETVWEAGKLFFESLGFELTAIDRHIGLLETNWQENRPDIPSASLGTIRSFLRRTLNQSFSTGRIDKFRMRVEIGDHADESAVYITHMRMEEEETTVGNSKWFFKDADRELEIEVLYRFLRFLGVSDSTARTLIDETKIQDAPSPIVQGTDNTYLRISQSYTRVWRKVGWALDRLGYVIEDRNRSQGRYFIRLGESELRKQSQFWDTLLFWKENTLLNQALQIGVTQQQDAVLVFVLDENGEPIANRDVTEQVLRAIHTMMH